MIRVIAIVLVLCAGCLREVDLTHGADATPPDGGVADAQFGPDAFDGQGPLPDAGIVHD